MQPVNSPTVGSKFSSKRHKSLTLNKKQEMIQLSEESMSTAEIGKKLGDYCQLAELCT